MSGIDSHHDPVKKKTARRNGLLTLSEAQRQFADYIASQLGGDGPSPAKMVADGEWQRFRVAGDKRGQKSGEYFQHPDAPFNGFFKDYRRGAEGRWRADMGAAPKLSPAEQAAADEERRQRDEKTKRKRQAAYDAAAVTAEQAWNAAKPAPATHAYLKKKRVHPHGIRIGADGRLVIPVYDKDGRLRSVQYIARNGRKLFHTGGQAGGGHYIIGAITAAAHIVLVCEGFATGASLHEATGHPVIVAFDADNVVKVAAWLRQKYPGALFVVCADDDKWKPEKKNAGVRAGRKAADILGAALAIPDFTGIDGKPTDFNDLAEKRGGGEVARQIKAALTQHAERAKRQESAAAAELPELPPFELPEIDGDQGRAQLKETVKNYLVALRRHLERKKWHGARAEELFEEVYYTKPEMADWSEKQEKKLRAKLRAKATREANKRFGKTEDALKYLRVQIAGAAGVGKTLILADAYRNNPWLWEYNINFYAPNVQSCAAFTDAVNQHPIPPGMPLAVVLPGYTWRDPEHPKPDCWKDELVAAAAGKIKNSVYKSFCDNGTVQCEFKGQCPYTAKRGDPSPKVRCFPHATAVTPQAQEMQTPTPDLVIMDESFITTAVKHTPVDIDKLIDPETYTCDLKDRETPADHVRLAEQVLEQVRTVPDVPRKLSEIDAERVKARQEELGFMRATLEPDIDSIARRLRRASKAAAVTQGQLAEIFPSDDAETVHAKLAAVTGDAGRKAIAAMFGQLVWDIEIGGFPDSLAIKFEPERKDRSGKTIPTHIVVHSLKKITGFKKDTPLIAIDADAIREANDIIFGALRWEEIRCKRICHVTQARDFLGSTSTLAPSYETDGADNVRYATETLAEIGAFAGRERAAAFATLKVRLALTGEEKDESGKYRVNYHDSRGFDISHNGVTVGRNLWHKHPVGIQIGREQPPFDGIDADFRAIYAKARGYGFAAVIPEQGYTMMRRRRFPGGDDFVKMHGCLDPRRQALLELKRERASAQNLDRLRLLFPDKRAVRLFILCELPLPGFVPDRLDTLSNILAGGTRMERAAMRGLVTTHAKVMAGVHPHLYETPKAAAHDIEREHLAQALETEANPQTPNKEYIIWSLGTFANIKGLAPVHVLGRFRVIRPGTVPPKWSPIASAPSRFRRPDLTILSATEAPDMSKVDFTGPIATTVTIAQRQDDAGDRIADLTRLDAEPTPEEAAAFLAAALEFFAALDAGHARHVDAVIDAAYAAADAELADDSAAAGWHRAYADALYRGREVPGPDWWASPPPSSDLPSLPPVDRPVPAGRWFKVTYLTVWGVEEMLYWFPDVAGGAFLDQCLRPHEPPADLRWFVEEIEPAA
jgi:phage/plasmid primase-like uncharacterized protein